MLLSVPLFSLFLFLHELYKVFVATRILSLAFQQESLKSNRVYLGFTGAVFGEYQPLLSQRTQQETSIVCLITEGSKG